MAREHVFEREQFFPRPIEEVFSFFSNPENLEKITPGFLNFKILSPRPIPMAPGTLIDYRLSLYGVSFHWRTQIESYHPSEFRFTDIQVRGPYALWHHTHEFTPVEGGTRMIDRVRYRIPLGPFGEAARLLFVRRSLDQIFDFRKAACERYLGIR